MPNSRAARIIRTAISPRLAINIFLNIFIALLPAWQGKGLGSTLLAAVLALADGQHTRCALSVEPFNPARRLYARLGFEVVGEQGLYLQMQRPLTQTCAEGAPMEP